MRTVVNCLVLLLSATGVARADQTDDFIRAQMKEQNIPGLSLVVLKDGEIIKSAGYGLANIRLNIPATPDTVYLIGSIGKQFVATGIMLLVQERALSLDDPISKHLEGTPASWNAITIRRLLTHTAGLVRDPPGYDPFKIQNDADVLKAAYRPPLRFAPGMKWEYSNTAYFPLAEVIRKVTGRPWSEYLSEKVFRVAGMSTTYPLNTTERLPNRARGYTDNSQRRDVKDWVAQHPAGGFLSTVLDLAKWDAVLSSNTLLSESSRAARCGLPSPLPTVPPIPMGSVGSLMRWTAGGRCTTEVQPRGGAPSSHDWLTIA